MKVLVVESDAGAAAPVIADLEAAGYQVARCHERGAPVFPCNALLADGLCPLDDGPAVDVVVDHRAHPYPRPTPSEDGVSCALRHHIPLVVSGSSTLNPFEPWTTEIADRSDDIVDACRRAVEAPRDELARPAQAVIDDIIGQDTNGPDATGKADVTVRRRGSRLHALVTLPADAAEIEGPLAVAVAGAIRQHDRFASGIDVAVHRADPID